MPPLFGHRHDVGISIFGGFLASFFAFLLATLTNRLPMQGQLVAGDTAFNRTLPTTRNIILGTVDGSNPMIAALTNTSWWIAVMMGAVAATFIIFTMVRRYV